MTLQWGRANPLRSPDKKICQRRHTNLATECGSLIDAKHGRWEFQWIPRDAEEVESLVHEVGQRKGLNQPGVLEESGSLKWVESRQYKRNCMKACMALQPNSRKVETQQMRCFNLTEAILLRHEFLTFMRKYRDFEAERWTWTS